MPFILLLLQVLPNIPGVIRAAESIHGSGNGADKLQTALNLISTIFPSVQAAITAQPANQSKLVSIINVIVAAMNAAGTMAPTTPLAPIDTTSGG